MARNYKELQARMDPASVADNKNRVHEELQRMALESLELSSNDLRQVRHILKKYSAQDSKNHPES